MPLYLDARLLHNMYVVEHSVGKTHQPSSENYPRQVTCKENEETCDSVA